ncbi:MAG TPA: hypothetical protein ENN07_06735 [candidate division Zixibacteria bacterium]|nr:hypothetical protein [candidate division Zixibacteria bacterium]
MKKTILLALVMMLAVTALMAEIPRKINYQGKLADADGIGIEDDVNMVFSLFAGPTGGTPLWTETHSGVSVQKGLFDVLLGSVTAFPEALRFDAPYWLEITVDGDIMRPRVQFYSVPYALSAGTATSVSSSAAGRGLSVDAGDSLHVNVRDGIEIFNDSLQIKNAGVSWPKLDEEVKDSIRYAIGAGGVSSLNTLTGDLSIVGEGGVSVSAEGSNIVVDLTLAPGDCPMLIDLTEGSTGNQYVPTNVQTFTPSIGQFLILGDDIGCTGGRMYGATLIATSTSGTIPDVDIWFDNVLLSDLSGGSVFPSGTPIISGATLTINPDSTVELTFPRGFVYAGNNLLVTMRKNSTAGIFSAWVGKPTATVNARYTPDASSFPMTHTANFRPNIKLNFLAPEIPDIVNDVNGITGSVNIIGGTAINVETAGSDITINYTGEFEDDENWNFRVTDGADTTLITRGRWGLARGGNTLHGNADSTHTNWGIASVTGTSGSNYKYATVGGGANNLAGHTWTTVSGGSENQALGPGATVGGGFLNTARDSASVIGGGSWNETSGKYSTIAGGNNNTASGLWSTVGGGYSNSASEMNATVAGGFQNAASGLWSAIVGGHNNQAQFDYAAVGGGRNNIVAGERAVIPGGSLLKVGSRSFGFRGGIGGNPTTLSDVSGSPETFHIVDAHFHHNYNNSAAHFRVDGTTDFMIYMNATSNRIGFNTNTMSRMIDINGTVGISDTLDMRQNQTINMVLENRTDNPPSPVIGQIWMRIDL